MFTYGSAALGYLLLAGLLLTRWRNPPLGPAILFACVATGVWGLVVASGTLLPEPPFTAIQVLEICKDAGWLFLVLQLLGLQDSGNAWNWLGRRWVPRFSLLTGLALAIIAAGFWARSRSFGDAFMFDVVQTLWVSIAVTGLLLIEQLYRNASVEERWGLKFLCLGLGVISAYDLFMYAQAMLFQQMDATLWQARGIVHTLVLPWLAVAIARNRNWRMELHVSRHVVFHTFTLMGAGAYLFCMALFGYFIQYLGGSWGGVLQIAFLAAGGVLLFTLLFSGTLRGRLRVLLSKHFFSYRYDYRVEWLRFTQGLAAVNEAPIGVTRTMAALTGSPGGMLIHRDGNGELNEVATWQLNRLDCRDLGNLPDWILRSGWVIDLREWRESPDVYEGLELPEWLSSHETLWLVIPLLFKDELEAVLLLTKTDLKNSVNWEDRDLLKTAGQQASALLAQHRASQALVEARQFDAFNRLSAYVIHDLKNILAQQSLMVSNARKHRDNPAFIDDMIGTVENSVKRMQRLMDQMRSGIRSADPAAVDLGLLLTQIVETRATMRPFPQFEAAAPAWVIADRERLSTVFSHLIQNAQEATADDGEVNVELRVTELTATVQIRDTGSGMSDHFIRERLFKPFESTKGLTGMGIGAFESREYVRQLGGDIRVTSEPDVGSCFSVSLPIINELESPSMDAQSCELDTPVKSDPVAH